MIFYPRILTTLSNKIKKGVIVIAGTNGKTTTSLMVKTILKENGDRVIHNSTGANLLNGVVSSLIQSASWNGDIDFDWAVFEIDENALPHLLSNLPVKGKRELILVFLNLFRDQLDRYGEVDVIAEKWNKALTKLPSNTKIIFNADDPLIAYLGKAVNSRPGLEANTFYFGLDEPKLFQKQMEHATDSIFCLNCGNRLAYEGTYFSHLGIWKCHKCGEKRPTLDLKTWPSSLPGIYNAYNTLAAVSVAKQLSIPDRIIKKSLSGFAPAFGRQEEFKINGKRIKIFLSKNPTGFNQSLKTVISLGAKNILLVLNDRIPDGRDVSWIWDVDFEMLPNDILITVSGDRVYDLALRIKYSQKSQISSASWRIKSQNQISKLKIFENLKQGIDEGLKRINHEETLYILPTYSAMLEIRKILKGRKIL